jgi:hypothetical protein
MLYQMSVFCVDQIYQMDATTGQSIEPYGKTWFNPNYMNKSLDGTLQSLIFLLEILICRHQRTF